MIKALERNDLERFRNEIDSNRNLIQNLSGKLKTYINDVFRKARINKASKIYEHGISMQKTARILGISVWELAEYAGQSKTVDYNLIITTPIKKRARFAERFFSDE